MSKKKKLFSDEFIRSLLLILEQTNFDEYMNLSYAVLMSSPSVILKRKDPVDEKLTGINGMIKYFEEKEEYEKCTNLQKLSSLLYTTDLDEDENDESFIN